MARRFELMAKQHDVVILGAGAAGLAAAVALVRAGQNVLIVEARGRIGGRIFTQQDPVCHAPIELGAEFVHGRPAEIWDLARAHGLAIYEVQGDNWCFQNGKLCPCEFFSEVESLLEKMDGRGPDESFEDFLERCCPGANNDPRLEETKAWARGYITGFNAADPRLISVHALAKERQAEEKIDGDEAFRLERGYGALLAVFEEQLRAAGVVIELNSVVESIRWRPGEVEMTARNPRGPVFFAAPRVVVTLPLGVLQAAAGEAGAVEFIPELPGSKQDALKKLTMGKVIRVVLRFRERFWEGLRPPHSCETKTLSSLGFLFSREGWFPTWWTTMPRKLPIITGWAPSHCAEQLSGRDEGFAVNKALEALANILNVPKQKLTELLGSAYLHDWQTDPFSRGAYSYVGVGGQGAQEELARAVDETLFFAGEACDFYGYHATVHGAIASGLWAAKQVLQLKTGAQR
jgi:monoamine oxidase